MEQRPAIFMNIDKAQFLTGTNYKHTALVKPSGTDQHWYFTAFIVWQTNHLCTRFRNRCLYPTIFLHYSHHDYPSFIRKVFHQLWTKTTRVLRKETTYFRKNISVNVNRGIYIYYTTQAIVEKQNNKFHQLWIDTSVWKNNLWIESNNCEQSKFDFCETIRLANILILANIAHSRYSKQRQIVVY